MNSSACCPGISLAPALARRGRLRLTRGGRRRTGGDGFEPNHQGQFARGKERGLIGDRDGAARWVRASGAHPVHYPVLGDRSQGLLLQCAESYCKWPAYMRGAALRRRALRIATPARRILQNRSGRRRTGIDRTHAQAPAAAPAAMIVVSVRGLGSIGIPSKHLILKAPVSKQQQRDSKAPLADIRTSMLRFSLEASFGSIRRQTFPSQPRPKGYLSS